MFSRRITSMVWDRLSYTPSVALLGPRQAGKTTLAHAVAEGREAIYLDLELPSDREKLADPELYLSNYEDKLVILDEVQRMPELFQTLRGLIDQGRRKGKTAGRFLLLGSASSDLLRQSETLAGRISYMELGPLEAMELPQADHTQLWVRGGFPDSFTATDDARSIRWREDFIRTYLERDIDRKSTRLNSSHIPLSRMPSSA